MFRNVYKIKAYKHEVFVVSNRRFDNIRKFSIFDVCKTEGFATVKNFQFFTCATNSLNFGSVCMLCISPI